MKFCHGFAFQFSFCFMVKKDSNPLICVLVLFCWIFGVCVCVRLCVCDCAWVQGCTQDSVTERAKHKSVWVWTNVCLRLSLRSCHSLLLEALQRQAQRWPPAFHPQAWWPEHGRHTNEWPPGSCQLRKTVVMCDVALGRDITSQEERFPVKVMGLLTQMPITELLNTVEETEAWMSERKPQWGASARTSPFTAGSVGVRLTGRTTQPCLCVINLITEMSRVENV